MSRHFAADAISLNGLKRLRAFRPFPRLITGVEASVLLLKLAKRGNRVKYYIN